MLYRYKNKLFLMFSSLKSSFVLFVLLALTSCSHLNNESHILDLGIKTDTTANTNCAYDVAVSLADYFASNGLKVDKAKLANFRRQLLVDNVTFLVFLREMGLNVQLGKYSAKKVISNLEVGAPSIVFVIAISGNARLDNYYQKEFLHCWLIRGVNKTEKSFLVNSPVEGQMSISYKDMDDFVNQAGGLTIYTKKY